MYGLLLVIIYVSFVSLGLPDSLLGSSWPVVQEELSLPFSAAGVIAMVISLCTVASSLSSDFLIRRIGTGKIVAISTIVAVTMAAVALIVRMASRNQKAVDEATAWLKRIVITWIILNSLGFIVAYLQPLITGGNYVG